MRFTTAPTTNTAGATSGKISSLADAARRNRDFRYFIELKSDPGTWIEPAAVTDAQVTLHDQRRVGHDEVTAFLVCYPNGEIVAAHDPFGPLPEGVGWLRVQRDDSLRKTLTSKEIEAGRARVGVEHSNFRPKNGRTDYFDHATTLTNRTRERVRVTRFSPYSGTRGVLTAGVGYTDEQFASWYGTPADGWIEPDASVSDPDNYADTGATWVYYIRTESGEEFVTGMPVRP